MAEHTHHDVYNVVAAMDITWHDLVETAYAYGMSTGSNTKINEVRDFLLTTLDSMDPQEAALYYPQEHELSLRFVAKTTKPVDATLLDERDIVAKATGTKVGDWLFDGDNDELGFQISGKFLRIKIQEGFTIRIDGEKNLNPGNRTFLTGGNVVKVTGSPTD